MHILVVGWSQMLGRYHVRFDLTERFSFFLSNAPPPCARIVRGSTGDHYTHGDWILFPNVPVGRGFGKRVKMLPHGTLYMFAT